MKEWKLGKRQVRWARVWLKERGAALGLAEAEVLEDPASGAASLRGVKPDRATQAAADLETWADSLSQSADRAAMTALAARMKG